MRGTDGDRQARNVPTLSELITERKTLRGFSYADLENRADSVISRQRWQQLGTGVRIKEFPEPATIEAMAAALDVDVAEVVLAAARSIGLNVQRGAQSDLAARLPYSADKLSPVQQDAIVTLVRSITEVHDVVPADSSSSSRAPRKAKQGKKITRKAAALTSPDQDDELAKRRNQGRNFETDPIIEDDKAAYPGDDTPTDYEQQAGPDTESQDREDGDAEE
ncbi:immunity repressor [Gordonia phage Lutum]|uniref:Immunity repressor n=1 Tax=Gordonia phage Lutum TaxID=2572527 RepID=A0A4D6T6R2_9CAUD|nr:immunity repressor [Gordonia phage Lutum]